jgi:bifunctional non-homologous end joining protein LigD
VNKKQLITEIKSSGGIKSPFPNRIDPMLATKIRQVFNDKDFIYEIKLDGYRIIGYKKAQTVELRTRSFENYSNKYGTIAKTLKSIPFSVVLDGEVIYLDENGKPSFDLLQKVRTLGTERLIYCVFDVLWCEGYSLLETPLILRKEILKKILPEALPHLVANEYFTDGVTLFEEMRGKGMEGIVAKEMQSNYVPGIRTKSWLKVQTKIRQEFVIGGWSESESGRPFRSLIFGYYDEDGDLIYYGHSGGGYTDKSAAELIKKLKKIQMKKKPFLGEVENETPVHWVKPILVAEFEYSTTTRSGKIRKPAIFKGLREDKDAKNVRLERPHKIGQLVKLTNEDSNWPELKKYLREGSTNILTIEEKEVELNNIEKTIWSDITKSDLINYYIKVAEFILPHLKDRPLSLHIKHRGVFAEGMYIKGMEGNQPAWAQTYVTERKHKKRGKSELIDYLICQDLPTLVYIINLGCIDVNPWSSCITSPLNPDYLIIDLDPTGGPFEQVAEVGKMTKTLLDKLRISAFVKTSGKTGLHILIPVNPIFTYSQARSLTSVLCQKIHKQLPDITTLEDLKAKRGTKVFLDDNQNDEADTIASAYSVRPYKTPSVSTPLEWREVNSKLNPETFTMEYTIDRLKKKEDLWANMFNEKILKSNTNILTNLIS